MGPPACCRTPEGESLLCGPGAAGTDSPPCRAATPCGSNMLGPRFRRFFSRGPTTRCVSPLPRNPHGSLVGPGTHGSPCLLGTPRGGSPCLRSRRGENRLLVCQDGNTLSIGTGRVPVRERCRRWLKAHHAASLHTGTGSCEVRPPATQQPLANIAHAVARVTISYAQAARSANRGKGPDRPTPRVTTWM